MKKIISSNIQGKRILILFILTNLFYVYMLVVTIPEVMSFSGGMKLLDMIPTGYNVEYVNTLLGTLGEKGREAYLFKQIPIDMIYPCLFGISYCLVLAYILSKLGKIDSHLFYFCLLPLASGVFDYCENIGIISMLNTYPENPDGLTIITNIFSISKSTTTMIYFSVLIIALIVLGMKNILSKVK